MAAPELSVVATVYNDAMLVAPLVEGIVANCEPLGVNYEVILVDDASSDDSLQEIRRACAANPRLKALSLARNHGQQVAMSAGIEHATGSFVLIMDGDLQNPPEAIPRLYNKIREGFDVVYCVSTVRNNGFDAFTSRCCWFFLNQVCKAGLVPHQLMMKIFNRRLADSFRRYREHYRLVSAIVRDLSTRHAVIEMENRKRPAGTSHYSFFRRMDLMLDFVISSTKAPLGFMMYMGILAIFLSTLLSLRYLYLYFFYDILPGFTTLIIVNLGIGGILVAMLGFIGKYLSSIYMDVKGRPLYHVGEAINLDERHG